MNLIVSIVIGIYLGNKLDVVANKIEEMANNKLK